MREQLAAVIRERTGLDEAMALRVAEVAIEYLKGQVPPAVAPCLDGQAPDLSQLGGLGGSLGGLSGQLGGLFGKRGE